MKGIGNMMSQHKSQHKCLTGREAIERLCKLVTHVNDTEFSGESFLSDCFCTTVPSPKISELLIEFIELAVQCAITPGGYGKQLEGIKS
jgi:hypothetical protein